MRRRRDTISDYQGPLNAFGQRVSEVAGKGQRDRDGNRRSIGLAEQRLPGSEKGWAIPHARGETGRHRSSRAGGEAITRRSALHQAAATQRPAFKIICGQQTSGKHNVEIERGPGSD